MNMSDNSKQSKSNDNYGSILSDMFDNLLCDGKSLRELLMYNGKSYCEHFISPFIINSNLITKFKILSFISSHCSFLVLVYDFVMKIFYSILYPHTDSEGSLECDDKKVIFTHIYHHRWVHVSDKLSGKVMLRNIFYDNIIEKLPDSVDIVPIYDYTINPAALIRYAEIVKRYSSLTCPMFIYWSPNILKDVYNSKRYFKKVCSDLKNNESWMSEVSSKLGCSIPELKHFLDYNLLHVLPLCVKYNLLFENLISDRKASLLLLVSEQTPNGRSWTKIGKEFLIPSVALQHGIFEINDVTYNEFISEEIMPDVTLVWSEYESRVLQYYAHFPKEQVAAVGNPRFDGLENLCCSRDDFIKKYGLNHECKIILWAAGFHGCSSDEILLYLEEVFSAVSSLHDAVLIIKPHPMDGEIYSSMINKFIQKYDASVLLMPSDSNTTELIYVSDLVIIKDSTVGEEAVIFHKPLIQLYFSRDNIIRYYVNKGIAADVNTAGCLLDVINSLFSSESPITKEAQDSYIKHHMYDNHASQRAADIIMQYLKKDEN